MTNEKEQKTKKKEEDEHDKLAVEFVNHTLSFFFFFFSFFECQLSNLMYTIIIYNTLSVPIYLLF